MTELHPRSSGLLLGTQKFIIHHYDPRPAVALHKESTLSVRDIPNISPFLTPQC